MSNYSDIYNSPSFEWLTLDEAFSTLPPALEEKLAEGWIQNNDLHFYVKGGEFRVRVPLRRIVPRS